MILLAYSTPTSFRLLPVVSLDAALAAHPDAPLGARMLDTIGAVVAERTEVEVVGAGEGMAVWAMADGLD